MGMKYVYGDINRSQIDEINQTHTNKKYLTRYYTCQRTIVGYSSLEEALHGIEIIVLAVPTKAIREVLGKIKEFQKAPLTIVHVSKGIEPDSLLRISEMIEEEMPCELIERYCCSIWSKSCRRS